ncbi:polysaccharide deacetylase family protein [Mycetocola sp.]|uniref:polysaccharide deacetylase family protein n=1 Tax=Mycetocola sp. TaxID=1871042 RepID=UPI003989F43F
MSGGWTRRTALLAGVTWLTAGCAPLPSQSAQQAGPSTLPSASPLPGLTPGPTPAPVLSPAPGLSPAPVLSPEVDPQAVAERFRSAQAAQWGLFVDGVENELLVSHSGSTPLIALTLDACGGSSGGGVDSVLLDHLVKHGIPATLFLNQRWIEANEALARQLARMPQFELGNHGTAHRPLTISGKSAYGIQGTASVDEVVEEIWSNHLTLAQMTGYSPRWFRSGTAHYDEVAVAIARELGERVVGFTVNGDAGATYSAANVESETRTVAPGGIVIAHMNKPASGTAAGLAAATTALIDEGFRFTLLDGADAR